MLLERTDYFHLASFRWADAYLHGRKYLVVFSGLHRDMTATGGRGTPDAGWTDVRGIRA
jgi:hypothetical protein